MSEKRRPARLAVDIGGTFTDIVLLADEQRHVAEAADDAPSNRSSPSSKAPEAC